MQTNTLIRVSGMILLAITVSLVALALVYAIQHPGVTAILSTVSWNG